MEKQKDLIFLQKEDLKETIKARANRCVGKTLKMCETVSDIETLKKVLKELLHEEWRDLADLLITGHKIFYSNYKDEVD